MIEREIIFTLDKFLVGLDSSNKEIDQKFKDYIFDYNLSFVINNLLLIVTKRISRPKYYYFFVLEINDKLIETIIEKQINFISENNRLVEFSIDKILNDLPINNNILLLNENKYQIGKLNIKDVMDIDNNNNQINVKIHQFNHKIIRIKYSFFDNLFGILLENNNFLIVYLENYINYQLLEINFNDYYCKNNVVDFNFFKENNKNKNKNNISWNIFSIVFLFDNGTLCFICPFFPFKFSIDNLEINKLQSKNKNNDKNSEIINKLYDNINKSKDFTEYNNKFISINDELNQYNKEINLKFIDIVYNTNIENIKKYKQFFIIKDTFPYIIFRIDLLNNIEIIVIDKEIIPITKKNYSINNFYGFVIENININYKNDNDIIILNKNTDQYELSILINNDLYYMNYLNIIDIFETGNILNCHTIIKKIINGNKYNNEIFEFFPYCYNNKPIILFKKSIIRLIDIDSFKNDYNINTKKMENINNKINDKLNVLFSEYSSHNSNELFNKIIEYKSKNRLIYLNNYDQIMKYDSYYELLNISKLINDKINKIKNILETNFEINHKFVNKKREEKNNIDQKNIYLYSIYEHNNEKINYKINKIKEKHNIINNIFRKKYSRALNNIFKFLKDDLIKNKNKINKNKASIIQLNPKLYTHINYYNAFIDKIINKVEIYMAYIEHDPSFKKFLNKDNIETFHNLIKIGIAILSS